MTKRINRRRNPSRVFACCCGTDGTEDTYDIVYVPTETVIACTTSWDESPEAKRVAQRLVRALNAFHAAGGWVYQGSWAHVGRLIDWSAQRGSTFVPPTPDDADYFINF